MGAALADRVGTWRVIVSSEVLCGGESVAGQKLFSEAVPPGLEVIEVPELHLRKCAKSPLKTNRRVGERSDIG